MNCVVIVAMVDQEHTIEASSGIKTGVDEAFRPTNSTFPIFRSMTSPILPRLPNSMDDFDKGPRLLSWRSAGSGPICRESGIGRGDLDLRPSHNQFKSKTKKKKNLANLAVVLALSQNQNQNRYPSPERQRVC